MITLELLNAVPVRHYRPGGGPGPGVWAGGHAEDDAAIQVSGRHYHSNVTLLTITVLVYPWLNNASLDTFMKKYMPP